MSYIKNLIYLNNLQPADVIVLKKKLFGMLDHFAVFLGYDFLKQPIVVANYTAGTKKISQEELNIFLQDLVPERIERFNGNSSQKQLAVQRALSKLGEENYSYLDNNCEHYATYVQKGVPHSKQAENFKESVEGLGKLAIGGLFIVAIASLLGGD